jgi:hypothetical protein
VTPEDIEIDRARMREQLRKAFADMGPGELRMILAMIERQLRHGPLR